MYKLDDGIYVVKNGRVLKIDSFTWGYEGLATAEHAKVVRIDGELVLFTGPGTPNNVVIETIKEVD